MIRPLSVVALLALSLPLARAQQGCRKISMEGDVRRGASFDRAITPQMNFLLQPTDTGWRIEVQPAGKPLQHDAAETATPPYASTSPLLLTTDFGLRAQDAVSWNPRRFSFVANPTQAESASRDEDIVLDKKLDPKQMQAPQMRLIGLAMHGAHGEFQILNASLVPGTADQSAAGAALASHWRTTPHTLVQPPAGSKASQLGSLEQVHFKVTLWLPPGTALARGVHATPAACPP